MGKEVTDWTKLCESMIKYDTEILDCYGIERSDYSFSVLEAHLSRLTGITELLMDKVSPSFIYSVTSAMPQLRKFVCHCVTTAPFEPDIWTTSCALDISVLRLLGRLEELKIGSVGGITLDDKALMPYLPNLKHVCLTGFRFDSHMNLESLAQQKGLVGLELGDCHKIEPQIFGLLAKLTNLKHLRLENGGNKICTRLGEALSKMKKLEELELMNFRIPCSLGQAVKNLNLVYLNVWPNLTIQEPIINYYALDLVIKCKSLKHICWGVIYNKRKPNSIQIQNPTKKGSIVGELRFDDLFQKLTAHFPDTRIELKCVHKDLWAKFLCERT